MGATSLLCSARESTAITNLERAEQAGEEEGRRDSMKRRRSWGEGKLSITWKENI